MGTRQVPANARDRAVTRPGAPHVRLGVLQVDAVRQSTQLHFNPQKGLWPGSSRPGGNKPKRPRHRGILLPGSRSLENHRPNPLQD